MSYTGRRKKRARVEREKRCVSREALSRFHEGRFTANLEESRNVYHGVVEAVEAGPESDDDSVESAVEDSVSQYESVDFKRMSAYLAQLTEPKTASDRVELPPELECLQMGCEEAEQRALGDTFFGIDNVATAERNAR